MKRPSFQFYPSDWLRDIGLRFCSVGARGLWIDMISFMHEGNPYGHLKVNLKVILPPNLAHMVGATLSEVEGWLSELSTAGVFEIDEHGAIFSRRMIRDENLRNIRAEGGKKGGNPLLKKDSKVNLNANLNANLEPKQNLTPSSSSSSSSSNKEREENSPNGSPLSFNFKIPKDWQEWALQERPGLDVKSCGEKFVEHWSAEGKPKKDWFVAWKKWVRNEKLIAQQENMTIDPDSRLAVETLGMSLGVGGWDGVKEQWHIYKAKVRRLQNA